MYKLNFILDHKSFIQLVFDQLIGENLGEFPNIDITGLRNRCSYVWRHRWGSRNNTWDCYTYLMGMSTWTWERMKKLQLHKILHIVFLIYRPSCLDSWRKRNYFGSLLQWQHFGNWDLPISTHWLKDWYFGGVVIRPAFKNAKQQFNPQQVESSRKIASVRIYVEQAITRVKAYRALDNLSISELKLASLNITIRALAVWWW
jgi:hypothetical protein